MEALEAAYVTGLGRGGGPRTRPAGGGGSAWSWWRGSGATARGAGSASSLAAGYGQLLQQLVASPLPSNEGEREQLRADVTLRLVLLACLDGTEQDPTTVLLADERTARLLPLASDHVVAELDLLSALLRLHQALGQGAPNLVPLDFRRACRALDHAKRAAASWVRAWDARFVSPLPAATKDQGAATSPGMVGASTSSGSLSGQRPLTSTPLYHHYWGLLARAADKLNLLLHPWLQRGMPEDGTASEDVDALRTVLLVRQEMARLGLPDESADTSHAVPPPTIQRPPGKATGPRRERSLTPTSSMLSLFFGMGFSSNSLALRSASLPSLPTLLPGEEAVAWEGRGPSARERLATILPALGSQCELLFLLHQATSPSWEAGYECPGSPGYRSKQGMELFPVLFANAAPQALAHQRARTREEAGDPALVSAEDLVTSYLPSFISLLSDAATAASENVGGPLPRGEVEAAGGRRAEGDAPGNLYTSTGSARSQRRSKAGGLAAAPADGAGDPSVASDPSLPRSPAPSLFVDTRLRRALYQARMPGSASILACAVLALGEVAGSGAGGEPGPGVDQSADRMAKELTTRLHEVWSSLSPSIVLPLPGRGSTRPSSSVSSL